MLNLSVLKVTVRCSYVRSDGVRVSTLEIAEGLNRSVTCSVSGVHPRPVFTWAGPPGLQELGGPELRLREDTYLLTSSSRLSVPGTRDNNNTWLSCGVRQLRRWAGSICCYKAVNN